MIVNKLNKQYQTRSDASNFNWLKSADWYVVDDNSELARKIQHLYPRFNFILNEKDELVDVQEIPKSQEEINKERVQEIKSELEVLDGTVDRQWEDYYIRENVTPVDRIATVITQKEQLRAELKTLTGGDLSAEDNVN